MVGWSGATAHPVVSLRTGPATAAGVNLRVVPSLGEHDVHVWVVALEHPAKQRRRELAHLALDWLLAAYLGVTPAQLVFERGAAGKPQLQGEPLQFSLSHSERLALVAVARSQPVGADVQAPHPATTRAWFARRICSAREYDRHLTNPEPDELLRLWVRKEAVLKARGAGSYLDVDGIDVLDDAVAGATAGRWLCRDLTLPGELAGYRAAVAVGRAGGDGPTVPAEISTRVFLWPGAGAASDGQNRA